MNRLIQGDILDVLPTLKQATCLIADPPDRHVISIELSPEYCQRISEEHGLIVEQLAAAA